MMSSVKKNILFLSPRFPYPLIGGDRLKSYKLLEFLGKEYNTTLISFNIDNSTTASHIAAIEKLGVKVIPVHLNVKTAAIHTAFQLPGSRPLEIDFFTRKAFQKEVDKIIREQKIDLAFAFFMRTAEYIRHLPIKKVLIAEDCRTLYMKRSYKQSKNIFQKAVRIWDYWKLQNYEPEVQNNFDVTTFVTEEDINAAKRNNPKPHYMILTNGTEIDKYKPHPEVEKKDLLFTGKLNVWANRIMATHIAKVLLPQIQKELPEVKLNIVGSFPTRDIRRLASDSIKLHVNVPDFVPYLQKARCYIHPHRGASGIQNKLLEAMSCGCPVVTSPTGNQGIHAKDHEHVLLCNSDREFIEKTIELLKNDDLAAKLSINARKHIVDTHSWEIVNQQLQSVINTVLNNR